MLALIEKRCMVPFTPFVRRDHPHLTHRDQYADTLEDMFDFENSPSLNAPVSTAAPANDCGPFSGVSSTPSAEAATITTQAGVADAALSALTRHRPRRA